jgi:DNA-binding HxlR family transcriptional regulator
VGMKSPERSRCPIATSLDVLGDRWSLVIVRDMIVGKRRFGEFLDSAEHITTSVLADRLAHLEAVGLVKRSAYQKHPERFEYALTDHGMDLLPLLQEFCRWGNRHFPRTIEPPNNFMQLTLSAHDKRGGSVG